MTNNAKKAISVWLVACLLAALLCGFGPRAICISYTERPFSVDGRREGAALERDGVLYISVARFCEAMPAELEISAKEGALTVSGDELSLSVVAGARYFEANGRAFWLERRAPLQGGSVLLPLETLAAVFGLAPESGDDGVYVSTEALEFLQAAEEFYDKDDLYWLSRLINSEAGGEPLDGMVAVGNVVLNRVASASFPNTVHDVVFDSKFGVQFSVVSTGAIYKEPSETALLAAKLCLEGCPTAGDALYFVNPVIGDASWFASSRTLVCSIGGHDFYA